MLHQAWNVFAAFGQLGQVHANDIQAVEQIFSEVAGLYQIFQVLMGCGDDADIHFDGGGAAYPVKLAIGQHPQQSSLSVGGHVADFIQKQGAAVGLFKAALAGGPGAGEGAFFVAEQFGFNKVFRNCRHVQGDERVSCSGAVIVQGLGHQFFTGAALTVDQYGDVGVRQPANGPENLLHGRGFTNNFGIARCGIGLWFAGGAFFMAVSNGPFYQCDGVIHIKGLGQVFEGAGLVAGHRAFKIRVRGHDDNRHILMQFDDLGEQGNTIHPWHPDIADDGVRLLVFQPHHDAVAAVEYARLHASLAQGAFQHPSNTSVIVDNPDVCRLAHLLSSRGRKMMKSVLPGSLSHSTSPRCWPMMLWVMERPSPVPEARPLIMG